MREALEKFLEKSKLRLKIKRCQTREGDEEENCSRQWEQHVQRLRGWNKAGGHEAEDRVVGA